MGEKKKKKHDNEYGSAGFGILYPKDGASRRTIEEMLIKQDEREYGSEIIEIEIERKVESFFENPRESNNIREETLNKIRNGVTKMQETFKEIKENGVIMNDGNGEVGNVGGKVNVNMGQDSNKGYAMDDSSTSTRLLDKNWSPLIVRKYQHKGWPLFISLICDANLDDLDATVLRIAAEAEEIGFKGNTIQSGRNFCGYMSDQLVEHYNGIKQGCNEGVAVLWYIDKCFISSLYGDFMVHAPCKAELFAIINTLPHI